MKVALSIAGSDSGGGAGIQADIKTFSALGVYGCTAITAITAQNTRRVSRILEIAPAMVEDQIRSILNDIPPDAIKVGMVFSRRNIEIVSRLLKNSKAPVVLDPIFAAGTGTKLLQEDAFDTFLSHLVPICSLITPNKTEAEKLSGMRIRTQDDGVEAAKRIKNLGAENVIVKGGHFGRSRVTDLLLDSKAGVTKIENPRVKMKESHGSGCNFSSAATAYLAKGATIVLACKRANEYVHSAIKSAVRVGRGLPVTNPLSTVYQDANRYQILAELQHAVEQLSVLDGFYLLIPETQTNIVFALPEAKAVSDVAAVRGRIIRIGNKAVPASYIEFGASRHVASSVIAFMGINPDFRSAINIKFDRLLVKVCRSLFKVSSYDRSIEPDGIKRKEGSSLSWGTRQALSRNPKADVIYHTGDMGKEPMITVYGRRPAEVVTKIRSILKNYQ